MNRKYDYLQEKEVDQPYNFIQESFQFGQDFEFVPQLEPDKRKSRTMHATITQEEPIITRNYRKFRSRQWNQNKSPAEGSSNDQESQNFTKRNNFIYHRTLDKFKEQICAVRIKQGMQQIPLISKMPKLIPSLSSNKKISSYSEKQVSGMQRRLKNRLQLVEKLKSVSKNKHSISSLPAGSAKETIRQTLDRRISDINKIVSEDAGSIHLKIHEMDPINQMHRIRMIVQKGHRQLKLVSDEQHDNIQENIYEVRQLMRKYLKEG